MDRIFHHERCLSVTDAPMMIILSGYIYQSMKSVFEWIMKRYEYQMASTHLKTRQRRDRRPASKPLCVMLKNVTKRYGEKVVLQDVFFSIREGERVLLCGPNGSGKTTLLRIILGLKRQMREKYRGICAVCVCAAGGTIAAPEWKGSHGRIAGAAYPGPGAVCGTSTAVFHRRRAAGATDGHLVHGGVQEVLFGGRLGEIVQDAGAG